MNPTQLKAMIVMAGALIAALVMGNAVANESYTSLVFGAFAIIFIFLLIIPGYPPLLAFGLLSPLSAPVPFIVGFPAMLLILAICLLKYVVGRGMMHMKGHKISAMTLPFWFFFGWVIFRYCLNPVLPNAAGYGENVTGFRPYLNYALCLGMAVMLGRFIQSRADLSKLLRWLARVSIFFIALLVPLMFTGSPIVAMVLRYFGLYVDLYDNGVFRFVALPGFGLILISLALLPQLLGLGRWLRGSLLLIGAVAILLGGNRSSLGMATAIVLVTPLLKRNFRQFGLILLAAAVLYAGMFFIGGSLSKRGEVGLLRVVALASPQLTESSQMTGTWEFRTARWRRAWEEIQNRPLLGRSYGGLENAFLAYNMQELEEAKMEIDLAQGGVHNGYIACALAFGIPAAVFFIGILAWQIWHNAKLAMRLGGEDAFARNVHTFICVNLVAIALAIFIGTDLNNPMLWFYLCLGVLVTRIRAIEQKLLHQQQESKPAVLLAPPTTA